MKLEWERKDAVLQERTVSEAVRASMFKILTIRLHSWEGLSSPHWLWHFYKPQQRYLRHPTMDQIWTCFELSDAGCKLKYRKM